MHYVISDIHGYYEKYVELLNKIKFSDRDTLYILGDIVDRGPEPMEVFRDIIGRENVVFIAGNHEYEFLHIISEMGLELDVRRCSSEMRAFYNMWIREGGIPTEDGFLSLPIEERQRIVEYIEEAFIYEELEINNKKYVLAHAGIQDYQEDKDFSEYAAADLLEGRTDYSRPLFEAENQILVTGHTPTFHFRADFQPMVFVGNGHIAVDCGAAYGGKLAAYCFETEEVFYV